MGDFLQAVGGQDAATGLAVVHPVDLGAAQAQQLGQAVGGIAQAAEVALVHHAAPIGDHHRAAFLGKVADGAGKALPQQIGHRQDHQPVAFDAARLIDKIHRDARSGKGVVVEGQLLPIAHAGVAGTRRPFDGPHVVPVVEDGGLPGPGGPGGCGQFFQRRADAGRLPEAAAVAAAVMTDYRAVEFFLCTAAGPPLEITDAVRPVRHRLQSRQHRDARLFLFANGLPVGAGRGRLHQKEGFALEGVEQIVHHGGVKGGLLHRLGGFVPGGVAVPADDVHFLRHLEIIDVVEAIHHVGGEPGVGRKLAHTVLLELEKVDVPAADETLPVESKTLDGILALGGGAFDLVPVGVVVAPEAGVPGFIQGVQGAVTALQPAAELSLTERAMAFAPHLVGDVPEDDGGVVPEALGQFLVDGAHLLSVDGRGIAVVLPAVVQLPHAVGTHPAHLGVLVGHPGWPGRAGGGQDGRDTTLVQIMDDVGQPVEVIDPLFRLEQRPGEHPQRHHVHVGLLHQVKVLCQDVGAVQPLFRVIVSAIKELCCLHRCCLRVALY